MLITTISLLLLLVINVQASCEYLCTYKLASYIAIVLDINKTTFGEEMTQSGKIFHSLIVDGRRTISVEWNYSVYYQNLFNNKYCNEE